MSKIDKIYKVIEDMENGAFLNKLIENMQLDTVVDDLKNRADKITESFNSGTFYKSTGGLKTAYKVEHHPHGTVRIELDDPTLINNNYRVDSEYIFEKVFEEGWHGGASINGKMLYPARRKKYGGATPYGDRPPWEKNQWRWFDAKQAEESPKEQINKMINQYSKKEFNEVVSHAFDNLKKEYGI